MRSFVTGSRAYGTPNKNSDVDLVILVSESDLKILKLFGEVTEPKKGSDSDPGTTGRDAGLSASIRFGVLNIIATTCPIAFAVWEKGTAELKRERPVHKDDAIRYFRSLRLVHGLMDLKDAE